MLEAYKLQVGSNKGLSKVCVCFGVLAKGSVLNLMNDKNGSQFWCVLPAKAFTTSMSAHAEVDLRKKPKPHDKHSARAQLASAHTVRDVHNTYFVPITLGSLFSLRHLR